jgi:Sec-independent protein translocase protein TatA
LALEAWEILAIVILIIFLLKPSLVSNAARSLGRILGEYKKGKSQISE